MTPLQSLTHSVCLLLSFISVVALKPFIHLPVNLVINNSSGVPAYAESLLTWFDWENISEVIDIFCEKHKVYLNEHKALLHGELAALVRTRQSLNTYRVLSEWSSPVMWSIKSLKHYTIRFMVELRGPEGNHVRVPFLWKQAGCSSSKPSTTSCVGSLDGLEDEISLFCSNYGIESDYRLALENHILATLRSLDLGHNELLNDEGDFNNIMLQIGGSFETLDESVNITNPISPYANSRIWQATTLESSYGVMSNIANGDGWERDEGSSSNSSWSSSRLSSRQQNDAALLRAVLGDQANIRGLVYPISLAKSENAQGQKGDHELLIATGLDGVTYGATDAFWDRVEQLKWEPSTLLVFLRLISPNTTVIDFGAWTGVTTLFASQLARRVISIEPDRVAHKLLLANLWLNRRDVSNVVSLRNCISSREEEVDMQAGPYHQGDGMSTVRRRVDGAPPEQGEVEHSTLVQCGTLLGLIHSLGLQPPYFIKVDTEGFEAELLSSWQDWIPLLKPTLFMSMHQHLKIFSEQEKEGIASTLGLFPVVIMVAESSPQRNKADAFANEQEMNRFESGLAQSESRGDFTDRNKFNLQEPEPSVPVATSRFKIVRPLASTLCTACDYVAFFI